MNNDLNKIKDENKSNIPLLLKVSPDVKENDIPEIIEAAIKNSDCILIPIRPSPIDFQVAIDTYNLINELVKAHSRKLVRFVLTQANMKSLIARQIKQDIQVRNFMICNQHFSARVAYAEAILSGSTPSYLQPRGIAAEEIYCLATEIDGLLNDF